MIFIVLLGLYALLSGLFNGWRALVRNRRASPPAASEAGEILCSWQAAPSPAFRVDPLRAPSWSSLTIAGLLAGRLFV